MDVNARSRTSTWRAHIMFGMHVTGQAIITSERKSHYTVCVCVCVPVNIANKYSISKFNIYDFHFNLRLCWCAVIFLYSPFQQPGQPVFFFCRCCCFDSIRYEYEFFICSLCARVRTVCLALFLLFCAVYTDVYCCLLFVLHGFIILTHFLRATQFSSVFFAIVAVYCQSRTNCFFSLSAYIFKRRLFDFSWGEKKKCFFFCSWIYFDSLRRNACYSCTFGLPINSTTFWCLFHISSSPNETTRSQLLQHIVQFCKWLIWQIKK